jgi:flagellar hook protein FlgE
MGLSSVLSTAITGLQAAETTIDVAGNNVANANTVGFKASEALFATQFLQTLSLGSAPTATNGGTNPRQIGLGTQVVSIVPDFTQGTLEISSNPSDLAIQGEGFFVVQSTSGEVLFTRNGKFQINAQNELVTLNGDRLLGYAVDENYQIQTTTLRPLTIPLGSAAVAKPTDNVFFEGTLTPTGDVADTPSILQSVILSDGSQAIPSNTTTLQALVGPSAATTVVGAAGLVEAGTYTYRIVFVDNDGNEGTTGAASIALAVGANSTIDLSGIQTAADLGLNPAEFPTKRIYRTNDTGANPLYQLVDEIGQGVATYNDNTTQAALDAFVPAGDNDLNTFGTLPAGDYSYYVTFRNSATGEESRPTQLVSLTVVGGRTIRLDNIPQANPADPGGFNEMRIYRSTGDSNANHYHVAFVPLGTTSYIDRVQDSIITNQDPLVNPNYATVDLHGPSINPGLELVNIRRLENGVYVQPFEPGVLSFVGRKGGRALAPKELVIDNNTTVQQLLDFMESAMGIQSILGNEGGSIAAGGGRLQVVGNNGVDNGLEIALSSLTLTPTGALTPRQVNLGFSQTQAAVGQSAVADVVVYDSLGIPINLRVTAVLVERTGTQTTYRWFADSADNDPANTDSAAQVRIAVGTGLIFFDGEGKLLSSPSHRPRRWKCASISASSRDWRRRAPRWPRRAKTASRRAS